jgi:hypothetical protein
VWDAKRANLAAFCREVEIDTYIIWNFGKVPLYSTGKLLHPLQGPWKLKYFKINVFISLKNFFKFINILVKICDWIKTSSTMCKTLVDFLHSLQCSSLDSRSRNSFSSLSFVCRACCFSPVFGKAASFRFGLPRNGCVTYEKLRSTHINVEFSLGLLVSYFLFRCFATV